MSLPFATQRFNWASLTSNEQATLLQRPTSFQRATLSEGVSETIQKVRRHGDTALQRLTEKYDGISLSSFRVSPQEISDAVTQISQENQDAIARAAKNIELFHSHQIRRAYTVQTSPGIQCSRMFRPLERVGLYCPGGTAPLPSTVLMLGVPAKIAGCDQRILCTPPNALGSVDPAILVAATQADINEIYKIGGAQAIAAMAYGTQTIPKVDKLFGPGNAWVTEAKLQVSLDADGAASDLPAGPSEVLVIADRSACPEFIAADLLSQAEHGSDSQVILLSPDASLLDRVQSELANQLPTLSRASIAVESLKHSALILVPSLEDAVQISNQYAPEHLMIQTQNPKLLLNSIKHAGSVFLGPWSPEAVGDYASGTNHVLPTYGYAKAYSGLGIEAFQKSITVQELSRTGLLDIGPTVERLAKLEGLDAHQQAVTRRLNAINSEDEVADNKVEQLARSTIVSMQAYESARGAITNANIFMDANEKPYSTLNDQSFGKSINRYPHPQPPKLIRQFAKLYKVSPDNLILGRGSDDIIDALLRTFCEANHNAILICPPTYGVYQVAAEIQGAEILPVPLNDQFQLNIPGILEAWNPQVTLIFICSPNNPTGTLIPLKRISTLCNQFKNRSIVVVDEAYIEFSGAPSATTLLDQHENLVILRTLSKAWGLAGARCGVGISHPSVINLLQKVRAPYPLSTPSIDLIHDCLSNEGKKQCTEFVKQNEMERDFLTRELLSCHQVKSIIPSSTNFLLVKTTSARRFCAQALRAGIVLRDRSREINLTNCVRISVGTRKQNESLLQSLQQEWSLE